MNITQLIGMAVNGELQALHTKNDKDVIVGYINLGLIELYKRFPLKTEEILITLGQSGTNYTMNTANNSLYTMPDDFMYIISAYGELDENYSGYPSVLPVNEDNNPMSINMVSWNTIQIPVNTVGATVSIVYASAPDLITYSDGKYYANGVEITNVPIPYQLVEALLHYVGYRGHASVNGEINSENSTHYTRFEKSCATIIKQGMFTGDDTNMNSRITNRCFV